MSRQFKQPNRSKKPVQQLCEHPQVISYTPKPGAIYESLDETDTDVKTCTQVARYVLNGVRYCDRHYASVTSNNSEEYGEYTDDPGLPDEPVDPQYGGGD
jgi:hypothetical protein